VPQIVQADCWDVGFAHQSPERGRDVIGSQHAAVLVCEDQAVVGPALSPGQPLGGLGGASRVEDAGGAAVDRDDAEACSRLRSTEPRPITGVSHLPADDEVPSNRVDVTPMQSHDLTSAHAREEEHVEETRQAVTFDRLEEGGDVSCCPDLSSESTVLRQLNVKRGVPGDVTALHRRVQGRAQGPVDVADRRSRSGDGSPIQHVGVKGIDMVRSQLGELDFPQPRREISADVALVVAARCVPEAALSRQPVLQVLPDGHPSDVSEAGRLPGEQFL